MYFGNALMAVISLRWFGGIQVCRHGTLHRYSTSSSSEAARFLSLDSTLTCSRSTIGHQRTDPDNTEPMELR